MVIKEKQNMVQQMTKIKKVDRTKVHFKTGQLSCLRLQI